ncbi:hypothetical protein [Luteimonas sp. FCS-9]|uniref:hypothetical protein n=1 Tax=Luteimonas sp. FCS-9 TaxID=1547516 RepID=UPI0012E07F1B|nr:hypothetical protein [Luteimonas sp. FCS-9]
MSRIIPADIGDRRGWDGALSFVLTASVYYYFVFQWFVGDYTDGDQLVIAEMAAYLAEGRVQEPSFWGQGYLLPLEAWFAAIPVRLGMPALFSVQLTAAFFVFAPYALFAWLVRGRAVWWVSAAFLLSAGSVILQVSLMPRGFTASVGLSAIGTLLLLARQELWVRVVSGAAIGLAVASSPMAIFPALVLLSGLADRRVLVSLVPAGIACCLVAALLKWTMHAHYAMPGAVVHQAPVYSFSYRTFLENVANDAVIAPALRALLCLQFLTVMGLIARGVMRERRRLYCLVPLFVFAVFMLLLFSSGKLRDALPNVFFSGVRFWTSIPLFFLCYCFLLVKDAQLDVDSILRERGLLVFAAIVGLLAFDIATIRPVIKPSLSSHSMVAYGRIDNIRDRCRAIAKAGPVDVYRIVGRNDLLAYGCYPLEGIKVFQTEYDRRTWFLREVEGAVIHDVSP